MIEAQTLRTVQNTFDTPAHVEVRCDAILQKLHLQVDLLLQAPWTVLFGPSGAGKSSLLRLLAGLWRPPSCHVVVQHHDLTNLPPHRRRIGFVSQSPALFPHLSVRQNVSFGLPNRADHDQVDQLLHRFGIAHLAQARIYTLSGGEAQRVAIARAVLPQPDLLLLDESFSGLDRDLRAEFIGILRGMQVERPPSRPMPIVSVTHDVGEAFLCADEVLRLQNGRVTAQGPAFTVLSPDRDDLLRQFRSHPS